MIKWFFTPSDEEEAPYLFWPRLNNWNKNTKIQHQNTKSYLLSLFCDEPQAMTRKEKKKKENVMVIKPTTAVAICLALLNCRLRVLLWICLFVLKVTGVPSSPGWFGFPLPCLRMLLLAEPNPFCTVVEWSVLCPVRQRMDCECSERRQRERETEGKRG